MKGSPVRIRSSASSTTRLGARTTSEVAASRPLNPVHGARPRRSCRWPPRDPGGIVEIELSERCACCPHGCGGIATLGAGSLAIGWSASRILNSAVHSASAGSTPPEELGSGSGDDRLAALVTASGSRPRRGSGCTSSYGAPSQLRVRIDWVRARSTMPPTSRRSGPSRTTGARSTAGRAGANHRVINRRVRRLVRRSATAVNRNDFTPADSAQIEAIPHVKGARGRPRRTRPERLVADRGCDHDKYPTSGCAPRGIAHRIGRGGTVARVGLGRDRWVVERTISRRARQAPVAGHCGRPLTGHPRRAASAGSVRDWPQLPRPGIVALGTGS